MKSAFLAVVILCTPVFAQTDAIVVTATRSVTLAPDQVSYTLAILTDSNVSLTQVLQASQSLSLAATDLLSINSQQFGPSPNQTQLVYVFFAVVPFSRFGETNEKIAALRRSLGTNTPPMDLQIYSIVASPSPASRQQAGQDLLTPLFAEAKQRAGQLAAVAGVTLGGVVGVTDLGETPGGVIYGPYGPSGPGGVRTTFSLSVRYAVK